VYPLLGAIDWSALTSGPTSRFEGAVTSVLPVAGIVLAATVAFEAIRRFVKAWPWSCRGPPRPPFGRAQPSAPFR
jgi:hypothetical protein